MTQAFLHLAVTRAAPMFAEMLSQQSWRGHLRLDVAVTGVPEANALTCYVWPTPPAKPTSLEVDIVAIDGHVVAAVEPLSIPLSAPPLPHPDGLSRPLRGGRAHQLSSGYTWHEVFPGTRYREWETVDRWREKTASPPQVVLWFNCPLCARARFAERRGAPQIRECRTCHAQNRARARTVAQFLIRARARTPNSSEPSRPSAMRKARVLALARTGAYSQSEIAQLVQCGPSNVSKILAKARNLRSSSSGPPTNNETLLKS